MITVGDEKYLQHIEKSNCWYDSDFMFSFSALVAHASHSKSVQLVNVPYDAKPEIHECRSLHPGIIKVVSVLHHVNHFAVFSADIPTKTITIFDGLMCSLKDWEVRSRNILQRCRLIPLDIECNFEFTNHTGKLVGGESCWIIKSTNSFINQYDSYNCGPIACLKIMDIFNEVNEKHRKVEQDEYRSVVVNEFKKLLIFHDCNLKVAVPEVLEPSSGLAIQNEGEVSFSVKTPLCESDILRERAASIEGEVSFSVKTPLRESDILRERAASSKRKRQLAQAERMKSLRNDQTDSLMLQVGSIVTIRNDYRDIPNPRGTVGIVFKFKESGGVNVVTENGVICYGVSLKTFFIPNDRYVINNVNTVLTAQLYNIRNQVLNNDFDEGQFPRITLQKDHSIMIGEVNSGNAARQKCGCKNQCTFRCGCIRNNRPCNSSCSCFGKCCNPKNEE